MPESGSNNAGKLSEEEFAKIFTRCRPMFVRIADSYVHDRHAAEDITDDSFIRLWEKRDEIVTGSWESYAFRSVINRCLDHLKSRSAQTSARQDMHESGNRMQMYEINSLRGCDPDKLFASEVETLFWECVGKMPEITRKIFVASRFENRTYNEIADRFGIPVRQVTSHIQYALKMLRVDLQDYLVLLIFLLMLKPIGHLSDDFDVIGRDPALTTVGKFDIVPFTHGVKNPYRGSFMEYEEVSGGLIRRRTLD